MSTDNCNFCRTGTTEEVVEDLDGTISQIVVRIYFRCRDGIEIAVLSKYFGERISAQIPKRKDLQKNFEHNFE